MRDIHSFSVFAVEFTWTGWGGEGGARDSYSWRRRFWFTFQRVGRASVRKIVFIVLCPFNYHGLGGVKRVAGISLLSATVRLVCILADREGERAGHSLL